MKVILRSDLAGLGKRGDIVEVADGYARNYLLPEGPRHRGHRRRGRPGRPMRRARDLRDAQRPRGGADRRPHAGAQDHHRSRPRPAPRASCSARSPPADIAAAVARRRPASSSTASKLARRRRSRPLGSTPVTAKLHSDVEFPITVEVVASS